MGALTACYYWEHLLIITVPGALVHVLPSPLQVYVMWGKITIGDRGADFSTQQGPAWELIDELVGKGKQVACFSGSGYWAGAATLPAQNSHEAVYRLLTGRCRWWVGRSCDIHVYRPIAWFPRGGARRELNVGTAPPYASKYMTIFFF